MVARAAAEAIIQSVSPLLVQVDDDGMTLEPVQVTYRVLSPTSSLPGLSVALERDGMVAGRIQLTDVAPGPRTVSFPPGIPLEAPAERLELRVIRPDQTRTAPVYHEIATEKAASHAQQAITLRPRLDRVTPGFARVGDPAKEVTIEGVNLSGMKVLHIRDAYGEWQELPVTSPKATSFKAVQLWLGKRNGLSRSRRGAWL